MSVDVQTIEDSAPATAEPPSDEAQGEAAAAKGEAAAEETQGEAAVELDVAPTEDNDLGLEIDMADDDDPAAMGVELGSPAAQSLNQGSEGNESTIKKKKKKKEKKEKKEEGRR